MNEPIRIPCEGSGHPRIKGTNLCQMCGKAVPLGVGGAEQHDRDDIIAMLRRGDFDRPRPTVVNMGLSSPQAIQISREEQEHHAALRQASYEHAIERGHIRR